MPTIAETQRTIHSLIGQNQEETRQRYARRRKIQFIDEIINEFEMLNLAEEDSPPLELIGRAHKVVRKEAHPISERPFHEVPIAEWMEALYDVQDTLMLPLDEGWE